MYPISHGQPISVHSAILYGKFNFVQSAQTLGVLRHFVFSSSEITFLTEIQEGVGPVQVSLSKNKGSSLKYNDSFRKRTYLNNSEYICDAL